MVIAAREQAERMVNIAGSKFRVAPIAGEAL
jgi:hypothetical protein